MLPPMRKAAATVSLLIATALLLAVCFSLFGAWHDANKRLDGTEQKAEADAILAGKEVVQPTDNSQNGTLFLFEAIGGAAFLVAGLALWPKRRAISV
jgi:hypothetical protein